MMGQLPVTANASAVSRTNRRGGRTLLRGIVAAAAMTLLAAGMAGPASAAPGDDSADTTEANVEVTGAIALLGLTPSFTLVGLPGSTVTGGGDVTMTVVTNNLGGYVVTVQSADAALAPTAPTNTDSIPISALGVRESTAGDTNAFTSLSNTGAVTVHSQAVRSAQTGDAISNDYEVDIPFVVEDTYTATLNYVATAL